MGREKGKAALGWGWVVVNTFLRCTHRHHIRPSRDRGASAGDFQGSVLKENPFGSSAWELLCLTDNPKASIFSFINIWQKCSRNKLKPGGRGRTF